MDRRIGMRFIQQKKHAALYSKLILLSLVLVLSSCKNASSDKHQVNSNPINSVNSGFIVQSEEGAIYYQDGSNNNNIAQLDKHGKVVFDDTYGMCLSIYDNYLYYREFGKSFELMRLKIDEPDNRETICNMNTYQTIIVDDVIYANVVDMKTEKEDGLYRISLDGKKKKKLVGEKINCMQYDTGYIYYAIQAKGQLFRMDLNGKKKEMITWKETGEYVATTHFFVYDNWIYFNNSNNGDGKGFGAVDSTAAMCRIRVDGTEFEELGPGSVANIYSDKEEDYLLYIMEDGLYTMSLASGEVNRILDKKITDVNVINDIIYALEWRDHNKSSVIYTIDRNDKEITVLGEN
jgi:hypothetical protein